MILFVYKTIDNGNISETFVKSDNKQTIIDYINKLGLNVISISECDETDRRIMNLKLLLNPTMVIPIITKKQKSNNLLYISILIGIIGAIILWISLL
jgi:hypothetical protein